MSTRLADSDEASAVINKFLNGGNDFLVNPIFSAGLCRVCVANINDNIKIL